MSRMGSIATALKNGTPFPECPPTQNNRDSGATIEARFGCNTHPRPRRPTARLTGLARALWLMSASLRVTDCCVAANGRNGPGGGIVYNFSQLATTPVAPLFSIHPTIERGLPGGGEDSDP
jgi:hypothetical protein